MRGYPQFSFWISIVADMIYLSHIVIIWEKYFPLVGTVLKNLLAEICHFNTQTYKNQFNQARSSRLMWTCGLL